MQAQAILWPMSVLAFWTGFVLLGTGIKRIRAVQRGRAPVHAFRMGESSEVPADVALLNRNLMNLLEVPVLFYAVSLAFYVTRNVDLGPVVLAWSYVGFRILHTLVHVTYNKVTHRLFLFAMSGFILLAMWILFVVRLS